MVEDEYHLDVDLTSPSIYETRRLLENAGTNGRGSRIEANVSGSAKQSVINGMRQGVRSNALDTRNIPPSPSVPEPNINLSREELLKLLSVFEGELQARDEVIEILKTERPDNQTIQDRYGLSYMPLQALRRDAALVDATTTDHVTEQTAQNFQKIIQHQKESYKKLKQALLNAEQANQALAMEINEEKKKHQDYMVKSDDFVNLLEDERERLKIALDKEKEISEKRENEMNRRFKSNKEELAKLKSLSLVLVEERQQQVAELAEHKKQIATLDRRVKEAEIKCKEAERDVITEKEHAVQLENDLESQSNKFFQTQEEFNMKLQEEAEKNEKLEDKVTNMTQQLKKLKTVQKNLQKTEDQLWRIHEKLEEDEEHDLLLEEVELLRERVKDMEESEKIYTQAQEDCKDIRQKLEEEVKLTRDLRSQLKTLKTQVKAQKDLQRSIEDTDFRFDELLLKFEFEKKKSNDMREQLQKMKTRMTDLDQYEAIVQETEEKMSKMKERIAFLAGEKKCNDDQVQCLVEKNHQMKTESKAEKDKVTDVTEKFIRESKKVLKLREELSQEKQRCASQLVATNEKLNKAEEVIKDLSSTKQTQVELANTRLKRQVVMLKSRLDQLEAENETKEAKPSSAEKLPKPGPSQPSQDIGRKLQAVEERCQNLSEQLQAQTKLNKDLKKQLSQPLQVNNNSNSQKAAMSKVAADKSTTPVKANHNSNNQKFTMSKQPVDKPTTPVKANNYSNSQKAAMSKPAADKSTTPVKANSSSNHQKFAMPKPAVDKPSTLVKVVDDRNNQKFAMSKPAVDKPTTPVKGNDNSKNPKFTMSKPGTDKPTTPVKVNDNSNDRKAALSKPVADKPTIPVKAGVKKDTAAAPKPAAKLETDQKVALEITNTTTKTLPPAKVAPTRPHPSVGAQLLGSRTAFLSSPETQKSPLSTPSLLRSSKVAPSNLHVTKKPATAGEGQKRLEPSSAPKEDDASADTIKITKDVRTGDPVVEVVEEQKQPRTTQSAPTNKSGSDKGLLASRQDSKFPKPNPPQRYFRTFQAQKDFSELQKKWAAKLAGK